MFHIEQRAGNNPFFLCLLRSYLLLVRINSVSIIFIGPIVYKINGSSASSNCMNSMHHRLRQFFPNFDSYYVKSVLRYVRDDLLSAVEGLWLANYIHASE